jgi:UDP-GlcNAc:undecaprenyl-phosphate/decaprenyl-phosphate GlcNAc-1-phosphate transferase
MSLPSVIDPQLFWLAARAFIITLILTPVCRDIFRSYWIVDQPDQGRKLHGRPIPRVGGIAILLGYGISFFVFGADLDHRLENELSLVWKLVPATLLVFAVGLIDDFIGLKPYQKLIGQFGAALLAYWAGVRVLGVGGYEMGNPWSLLITILWILVCTNAFNLLDGLDGLAAGVGFFATLTIFTAALLHGNTPLAFATLPLAGALLGFLCFNFNPATIFLGDGGSLLLGFLLGCYGAVWTQKSVTLLGMTAPLIALSIPLIDVMLCVMRRFLRNKPIFTADRGHIHHRLLDRGLTPRRAVLAIYGASGIAAAVSLMQGFVENVYIAGATVLAFCAIIWGAVRFLGYAEFMLAGRILRTGGFQQLVTSQLELDQFRKALSNAKSMFECQDVIRDWYPRLGFDAVRMRLDDTHYESWGAEISPSNAWMMRVPLPGGSWIEFAKLTGSDPTVVVVSSLVETLTSELTSKLDRSEKAGASVGSVALPAGS